MKKLVAICLMALCCVGIQAQPKVQKVPATPHPIEITQPNGEKLMIRLIGDERMHFNTTLDGYLIKKNKKEKYCYAYYSKKGETKVSCKQAHNADDRSKKEKKYVEKNIPKKF